MVVKTIRNRFAYISCSMPKSEGLMLNGWLIPVDLRCQRKEQLFGSSLRGHKHSYWQTILVPMQRQRRLRQSRPVRNKAKKSIARHPLGPLRNCRPHSGGQVAVEAPSQ